MDFHGFRRYVFITSRNETNVIIYYFCRLSTVTYTLADSKWLECSFCTLQYCDLRSCRQ